MRTCFSRVMRIHRVHPVVEFDVTGSHRNGYKYLRLQEKIDARFVQIGVT